VVRSDPGRLVDPLPGCGAAAPPPRAPPSDRTTHSPPFAAGGRLAPRYPFSRGGSIEDRARACDGSLPADPRGMQGSLSGDVSGAPTPSSTSGGADLHHDLARSGDAPDGPAAADPSALEENRHDLRK